MYTTLMTVSTIVIVLTVVISHVLANFYKTFHILIGLTNNSEFQKN